MVDYSRFLPNAHRPGKINPMPNMPINLRRLAMLMGIVVLVFVIMGFNARIEEYNRQTKQVATVRAQATQVMETQLALQTQVAYSNSTTAVEEWARTDGHYIRDGDLPVVPIGKMGSTSVSASTPTPIPTPLSNWQVWWNLFFGE